MSVTVIYSFEAAPGKADELLALLQQGREFAAQWNGFEAFDVHRGNDDPHRFVMVECWTSVGAHQAHFETNVKASGVLDRAEALMTAPFQVSDAYYVPR
jgi:quinol monooxygenase YgiN